MEIGGAVMLRPEEIRELARRQPFVPFRIHVSDQQHYDVLHPDMIMIGERSVTIGMPGPAPWQYVHTVIVSLAHITRIDKELSPASSN
jgi:hypothetical protein